MSDLQMRPGCECCDADLAADRPGAMICSFECTYCAPCAEHLGGTCATCGGDLVPRPTRTGAALERHPASSTRVVSDAPCPGPPAGDSAPERLRRHAERGSAERSTLDALLDEVLVGTLATVVDGRPRVVPMLFARDGDRILLHGSTGAGTLRGVAAGAPAAFAVTAVDGLVVAHTTFESSANYRSAVLRGTLVTLSDEERYGALEVVSERLLPGRTAEVRAMTPREQAATLAMALPITDGQWVYKARSGGPGEPDEETTAWTGVVPLRTVAGEPDPAPHTVASAAPVPGSVRAVIERYTP